MCPKEVSCQLFSKGTPIFPETVLSMIAKLFDYSESLVRDSVVFFRQSLLQTFDTLGLCQCHI